MKLKNANGKYNPTTLGLAIALPLLVVVVVLIILGVTGVFSNSSKAPPSPPVPKPPLVVTFLSKEKNVLINTLFTLELRCNEAFKALPFSSDFVPAAQTVTKISETNFSASFNITTLGEIEIILSKNTMSSSVSGATNTAESKSPKITVVNARPAQSKGLNLDDQTSLNVIPSTATQPIFPKIWPDSDFLDNNAARTFKLPAGNQSDWVFWLLQNDFEVIVGMTPENATDEVDRLVAAYVSNKSKFDKNILAYAIGNEIIADQRDAVAAGMTYIRSKIATGLLPSKPVTVNFNYNSDIAQPWLKPDVFYPPSAIQFSSTFTTFFDLVKPDIIFFNTYGVFFDSFEAIKRAGGDVDKALSTALSWTPGTSVIMEQFSALNNAMQVASITVPLWIGETGWCSQSRVDKDGTNLDAEGWSTPENLKTYYEGYLAFEPGKRIQFSIPNHGDYDFIGPERVMFFTLRDSVLHGTKEFFGLYEADTQKLVLKPVLDHSDN